MRSVDPLIVHHTPSPAMHTLLDAVPVGATDPQITGVEVVVRPALPAATAVDVLEADGFLLGTPANLGYMSGALKHFFDQIYYPCLEATSGARSALYVHGNDDTTGAAAGDRDHHHRSAVARGPGAGLGARRPHGGRHRRLLGARCRAQRLAVPQSGPS